MAKNREAQTQKQVDSIVEGARAKARYASTRPDGSINTHPQERMRASSHRQ